MAARDVNAEMAAANAANAANAEAPSPLTRKLVEALESAGGAAAALQHLDEGADAHAVVGGKTPLVAAAAAGHLAVVSRLLAAGALVDFATPQGYTALIEAAAQGHVKTARLLIEAGGADISHATGFGNTALAKACGGQRGSGSEEIALLLLEKGAARGLGPEWLNKINRNGMTALDHAIVKEHEALADAIRAAGGLTSAEVSASLPPSERLLWATALHPRTGRLTVDVEVALRLIDEGEVDLERRDKNGCTALTNAWPRAREILRRRQQCTLARLARGHPIQLVQRARAR